MWRSGSVEVRPRRNDRSESEQALTLRHCDEIRLGDGVGRISSVRLDFAALRAELSGGWAHFEYSDARIATPKHTHFSTERGRGWRQLPVYKYPVHDAGAAVPTATNDARWPTVHATALPYMQCMPCNARIACMACMACATRMPRKACVTRSDRTMLLCTKSRLPAQIKMLSQVHVSER